MPSNDAEKLKQWFSREKRDFPWREDTAAYRVWISEIMLQQTRASVVTLYFEKWMKQFPTLADLAVATEDAVIKAWEGLGYYNRARNILKAAHHFQTFHNGIIPAEKESLLNVPGLGPYTVGAILSFAFKKKAAAVDGNVARVISRYYCFEEDISSQKSQKKLQGLTEDFLPDEKPWEAMEALIELGAKVCGKTPQCLRCPLQAGCKAHLLGKSDDLPLKKKPKEMLHLAKEVLVLKRGEFFLVQMKEKGRVLGGLYEFISFDKDELRDVKAFLKENFRIEADKTEELQQEQYSYTHHAVELFPSIWETSCSQLIPGFEWKAWQELFSLPFTSGHRRILANLAKERKAL